MIRKLDNFLLGLLWLLSVALATTFWMNINYGFNILSAAHWAYLSELQASRAQVKFDFYISLIVALAVGIVGLYILIRPRFRTLPILQPQITPPSSEPISQNPATPVVQTPPQATAPARPISPSGIIQRQSPTSKVLQKTFTPPTKTVVPVAPKIQQPSHDSEIQAIFESEDYVLKPSKKIDRIVTPIVALGYDNSVWICTSGASVDDMRDAIQTVIMVLDDTLGNTADDLSVRGCIVNTDEESDNPDLILTFHNINEFREFMSKTPNNKPDDFDSDLFDAISTYISTLINYIGKK